MNIFPTHKLKAVYSVFCETWGPLGLPSITIELEPFSFFEEDQINTSIKLDHIPLPHQKLKNLAGKQFHFPTNPEDGYIDGSIYLFSRHRYIDIHTLNFGNIDQDQLLLTINGTISIENLHETVDGQTPFALTTVLDLPFSDEQLMIVTQEAINHVQANKPKDIGRVMQYLKQQKRYQNYMQQLHQYLVAQLQG